MPDLKNRIKIALQAYHFSVSKLAGGYNCSAQTKLNRQINGDTGITADTLEHILTTFPNLSAEWLMRGEGSMFKCEHTTSAVLEPAKQVLPAPPAREEKKCEEKDYDKIIALQQDAIKQRDKHIETLELLIAALRNGQKI